MEALKKLDKRKIKPKIIGSNKERIVMINVAESSLDLLRSKKTLTIHQYYTALRYRRIWEKSKIGTFTCDFNKVGRSRWNDMAVDRIDAIFRLSKIHEYIGDFAFELLYKVCVLDHNLKEITSIYNFPKGYAGNRLREAIEELKKYFEKTY
tara:strand:+ start:7952 stop:8404 length:453 start_codon:yes stop_codon:yes gene_type:complete